MEISEKTAKKYLKKINDFLTQHNYYGVMWYGAFSNYIMICELPKNPEPYKTTIMYKCMREEFYDKFDDGKIVYKFKIGPDDLNTKNVYNKIIESFK